MHPPLSRRHMLGIGTAFVLAPALPRRLYAAAPVHTLAATSRTLDIDGRAATVFGLVNEVGGAGLILEPGERFSLRLTNDLAVETLIHWHGQIPPNVQDGVPGLPSALIAPGGSRDYDFAARTGTHWMHAHIPLQEMQLLAAPLIVRQPSDARADRQEVVLLLHDFSFSPPEELMAALGAPMGGMAGMDHDATMQGMDMTQDMPAMDMSAGHDMSGMVMDLNDIAFDAYLTNDRTLADPQIVRVDPGTRVLLRIINASAATAYHIDCGALPGQLVAVDGEPVVPRVASGLGLAMAQRLDVEVTLPREGGAWPILARREGARDQTGLILATPGAQIRKLPPLTDSAAPAFDRDLALEGALQSLTPMADRPADRRHLVTLGGTMQPYRWTINDRTWGDHAPLTAITGERVELIFRNLSDMAHPMHLHGHVFQVVAIGARRFEGARRDTVWLPPKTEVTVALDAGEAARWMLHCHHLPHLQTGMMTELAISA